MFSLRFGAFEKVKTKFCIRAPGVRSQTKNYLLRKLSQQLWVRASRSTKTLGRRAPREPVATMTSAEIESGSHKCSAVRFIDCRIIHIPVMTPRLIIILRISRSQLVYKFSRKHVGTLHNHFLSNSVVFNLEYRQPMSHYGHCCRIDTKNNRRVSAILRIAIPFPLGAEMLCVHLPSHKSAV